MSDLQKATAIVVEYLAFRPGIRSRLTEQTNSGMKAQSLEQTRDTFSMPAEGDDRGPRVTDTTGEAAIRTDRARRLLAELDHAEGDLVLAANTLIGHPMANWSNLTRVVAHHGYLMAPQVKGAARVFDRALGEVLGRKRPKAGLDHAGRPGCQSCCRLKVNGQPLWAEPTYNNGNPTDLGGILKSKMRLDWSCYRFVLEHDRLPTVEELRHRENDARGRWPVRHTVKAKAS